MTITTSLPRSWCPDCEEICTNHSTICTTCGATLMIRPVEQQQQQQRQRQRQQVAPPSVATINAMDAFALWNHDVDALDSAANTLSALASSNYNIDGTTSTATATTATNNNNDDNDAAVAASTAQTNNAIESVRLVRQDVQLARNELQQLMSTIRARIVDAQNEQQQLLETLRRSRNELNIWETIPNHILDPNNNNDINKSNNATHEIYLQQIPRIQLQQDCNLFQFASLSVYNTTKEVSSLSDDDKDHVENHVKAMTTTNNNEPLQIQNDNTNNNHHNILNKVEVIPGEFGTTHYNSIYNDNNNNQNNTTTDQSSSNNNKTNIDDCSIQLNDAYFIIADPITGKGNQLNSTCINDINQIIQSSSNDSNNNNDHTKNNHDHTNNNNNNNNNIVLFFLRGDDVTFVRKAILGQQMSHHIKCIVIGNNISTSPWPYTMKDSKMEAIQYKLSIPVVMTSYNDTQTILKQHNNTLTNNMKNNCYKKDDNHIDCCTKLTTTTKCSIQIYKQRSDDVSKGCIICTESYHKNQIVIQLPVCKHTFHEECVLQWLRQHNTCPYCRYVLPSKSNPIGHQPTSASMNTNQNNTTFYS